MTRPAALALAAAIALGAGGAAGAAGCGDGGGDDQVRQRIQDAARDIRSGGRGGIDQAEKALRELEDSDLPEDARRELEDAKRLLDQAP